MDVLRVWARAGSQLCEHVALLPEADVLYVGSSQGLHSFDLRSGTLGMAVLCPAPPFHARPGWLVGTHRTHVVVSRNVASAPLRVVTLPGTVVQLGTDGNTNVVAVAEEGSVSLWRQR